MSTVRRLWIVLPVFCALVAAGCSGSYPRFTPRDEAARTSRNAADHNLEGIASYYADEFDGKHTASGEIYNMQAMTAAHRTLPFNTMVRVTNKQNGRSIVVRVNDRGPFKNDRIIDLSLAAAKKLGLIAHGTAPVTMEVLEMGEP